MFRVSHTPPLSYLLEDLLTRDHRAIAKHLDVTVPTLQRWILTDTAPRSALLALFYETRWGYSLIETTAFNGRMYAEQETRFGRAQIESLKRQIAHLEALGDFGAANAPRLEA
jgi:hypothetical protein